MFTLRGPEFLALFAGLAVLVYVVVNSVIDARETALQSDPRIRDPYAIAYLRGDIRELLRVVALSLCLRGLLRIDKKTFRTVTELEIDRVQVPIETKVLQLCTRDCAPPQLVADPGMQSIVETSYRRDLVERGLLADSRVKGRRWPIVLLGCAVLVLIAFIKIKVALATGHRNIGFLVVLTGLAVIVLLGRARARRTASGSDALRKLSTLFASLRKRGTPRTADSVSEAALLAAVFGIYGVSGLDSISWARMFPSNSSSDGGGGCGSSGGCGGGGGGCGGCGS
jgi:uncharacterized protein (TIGR04222 family)